MKTPVELIEDVIRSKKSSIFLRHSVSTEKELKALAQKLYDEVVAPWFQLEIDEPFSTHEAAKLSPLVTSYAQEEFPFQ